MAFSIKAMFYLEAESPVLTGGFEPLTINHPFRTSFSLSPDHEKHGSIFFPVSVVNEITLKVNRNDKELRHHKFKATSLSGILLSKNILRMISISNCWRFFPKLRLRNLLAIPKYGQTRQDETFLEKSAFQKRSLRNFKPISPENHL